jgi:hypothetical protein
MAHSSASKKSNTDDSGSDSEEEVNNDSSFFIAENARLNDLLDNCDDVLKKTNKAKREYRSLPGVAKEKVTELESLLDDARAQIDSLKSAPVVTNEPECTDCSTFLGELTVLKEKYASKVEELDVLRVELDEMKSFHYRNTPVLSEKVCVVFCCRRSLVFILPVLRTSAKNRRKKQPFAAPSPPYLLSFRFHLLPAAFVSCSALSFNIALLFECANP